MSQRKTIVGTPLPDANMIAPWGLDYAPATRMAQPEVIGVAIPVLYDGAVRVKTSVLTLESFYELREAVNDLYDHIRQEQPSD